MLLLGCILSSFKCNKTKYISIWSKTSIAFRTSHATQFAIKFNGNSLNLYSMYISF